MKSNIAKFLIVVALLAGALPVWGKFSIELDSQSNVRGFVLDGKRLTLPTPYSYFELDGKLAEAGETNGAAGRRFQLNTGTAAGIMRVVEGVETSFHFEQAEGAKVKNLALVLTWPAAAELHLAEYLNVGRLLDRDMPPGETYQGGLRYNFFVVQAGGMCVRFRAEEKRWQLRSTIHVARHPEMFTVTFTWEAGTDLSVAGFGALREAVADHEQWLRKEAGMRPLAERAEAPAWVREVKLVVTADMMRSHWEIANDYQDLLNLAREISRIRNPREVLFYIPGWQGAYDAVHPDYRPHPDLGGAAKFKELTDYLHQAGFRLMIHTTGWGIDPYRTDIDVIEKIARRDEKGEMMGWQTPFPEAHPPRSPLKFKTPRIPLTPEAGLKSFAFTTDTVPAMCEALFTVGSNKPGKHRIRLTAGHRTLITPTGWFENHIEYQFPFPLMLAAGRNEVRVEVTGDGGWPGGWYQVRDTYVPPSPYHTWTHPILMADVTKPEYIRMFTDNLRSVVREYGIDAGSRGHIRLLSAGWRSDSADARCVHAAQRSAARCGARGGVVSNIRRNELLASRAGRPAKPEELRVHGAPPLPSIERSPGGGNRRVVRVARQAVKRVRLFPQVHRRLPPPVRGGCICSRGQGVQRASGAPDAVRQGGVVECPEERRAAELHSRASCELPRLWLGRGYAAGHSGTPVTNCKRRGQRIFWSGSSSFNCGLTGILSGSAPVCS